MQQQYDVVIAGAGPAGLSAAIFCGKNGAETLLLERSVIGGQPAVAPTINDYPGLLSIDGWSLTRTMQEQAEASGVEIAESIEVSEITSNGNHSHTIKTSNTPTLQTRAVIITSGTTPKDLAIPGSKQLDRKGVHYCAQCAGLAYKEKSVAVYGNGHIALQAASHLLGMAKNVFLVTNEQKPYGERQLMNNLVQSETFHHIAGHSVTKIIGQDFVTGLEITNLANNATQTLQVQALFSYQGVAPCTYFIDAQKNSAGFLQVDRKLQTSVPGIFAAGNVVQQESRIIIAAGQGAQAALSAITHINT